MEEIKKYEKMSPFEVKNELIAAAQRACAEKTEKGEKCRVLNAGRGNPNFLNTTAREAFCDLSTFIIGESKKMTDLGDVGLRPKKEGLLKKLEKHLNEKSSARVSDFLIKALDYLKNNLSLDPEVFLYELATAALGDFYPMPSRIFPEIAKVIKTYLNEILTLKDENVIDNYQVFATEGAAAAMVYLFHSMKINKIIKPKDHIAIVTPIFSPYLEIPHLKEFNLTEIFIEGNEKIGWHIPEEEFEKLKSPQIKALYLVNPANPTSVTLHQSSLDKITSLVKNDKKDMIVITDTVYATFIFDFHSLLKEIPHNTVCVYSYSKYFGVTGWRLGVIMLHQKNIIDDLIFRLPLKEKRELEERYKIVSPEPEKIKFIDRLEMESRDLALAHTGGLSCPQQAIMCLFSLFELVDREKKYKKTIHSILKKRIQNLYDNIEIKQLPHEKENTYYYTLIDFSHLAEERYGKEFANYLLKKVSPFEFLFKLAKEKYTILLPGQGFAGPRWSFRVSLANLADDDYITIGKNLKDLLDEYYKKWKK